MSRVTIPEQNYQGYIFDLDGTLVDSMFTHFRAWRKALALAGAPAEVFRAREFVAYGGRAAHDIVAALNIKYSLNMDAQSVANHKRELYLELLQTEKLSIIEECIALVRRLKAQGIPYAIGTGSAITGALETLRSAEIEDLFSIIITPDEVPAGRGKPQPDIFLLCAEKMGVDPTQCIVFEDAQPGIDAAIAGGMAYAVVAEPDMSQWDSIC
ncbi:MAG: HAD-IA family hydrolase [Akkermansia sp.]